MQALINATSGPLLALVQLAILAAIAFAANWLRAHTTNVQIQGIIDRAKTDIDALVSQEAQLADQLRQTDGTLSGADAIKLKDDVVAKFMALRNPDGIAEIKKVLGFDDAAFKAWISAHIEQAVRDDKKEVEAIQQPAPVVVPVVPAPTPPAAA